MPEVRLEWESGLERGQNAARKGSKSWRRALLRVDRVAMASTRSAMLNVERLPNLHQPVEVPGGRAVRGPRRAGAIDMH